MMLYEILYYVDEKKYYIMGILVGFLLFFLGLFFLIPKKNGEQNSVVIEKKIEPKDSVAVNVDIKGAVLKPGVYQMRTNEIVLDVIKKAGGFTKNADLNFINLSKKIQDEMVIVIYTKEEIQKMKEGDKEAFIVEGDCRCPEIQNDGCIQSKDLVTNEEKEKASGKINLNKATLTELTSLPGIGNAKATAIIAYRKTHGNFQNIEEIKKVTGIGDAVYEKIKEQIIVS